jgi:competence protein ComEC
MIGHEGREAYMKTFGGTHQALKRETMVVLKEGAEMTLDGVRIQVLYAPAENLIGGNTGNEFSNLIRVSYGQQSFLFTGDLAKEHEQILCKGGTALHSTVLKVGHHGSNTSSSEEFLRAVNPQWSVISVGYGNSFGHPKPEILARIHNCTNSRLLRTDKHGAIVFTTDGEQLRVNTQVVYDKENGG